MISKSELSFYDKLEILKNAGWNVYAGTKFTFYLSPQCKRFYSFDKAWKNYIENNKSWQRFLPGLDK